jgi:hypothetical protein
MIDEVFIARVRVDIAKAVLGAWLAGKEGLTVKEIAAAIHLSETAVRRHMNGAPVKGTRYFQGEKQTFSKDYPGMQAGVVRVGMYAPDDEALRAEIRGLRDRVSSLESEIDACIDRSGALS